MDKYFTGFVMAWGNFFWIPCPFKKWDDSARNYMLSWLPTIGCFIGGLWLVSFIILIKLNIPVYITAFLMTFIPFLLSGFIHVDGFMDVSDAIYSWGTLEKKQQILKDSHVGSGAVIRMIFYVLLYYSSMLTVASNAAIAVHLIIIPIIPRSVSTMFVYLSKKIGETEDAEVKSQYVGLKKEGLLFLIIQVVIYVVLLFVFSSYYIENAMLVIMLILGTAVPIVLARKKLGGMNGDIAGYGILFGELFGVLTIALLTRIF